MVGIAFSYSAPLYRTGATTEKRTATSAARALCSQSAYKIVSAQSLPALRKLRTVHSQGQLLCARLRVQKQTAQSCNSLTGKQKPCGAFATKKILS